MRPAFYSAVVVFHNLDKQHKKKSCTVEEKTFNNIGSHVVWPNFLNSSVRKIKGNSINNFSNEFLF